MSALSAYAKARVADDFATQKQVSADAGLIAVLDHESLAPAKISINWVGRTQHELRRFFTRSGGRTIGQLVRSRLEHPESVVDFWMWDAAFMPKQDENNIKALTKEFPNFRFLLTRMPMVSGVFPFAVSLAEQASGCAVWVEETDTGTGTLSIGEPTTQAVANQIRQIHLGHITRVTS